MFSIRSLLNFFRVEFLRGFLFLLLLYSLFLLGDAYTLMYLAQQYGVFLALATSATITFAGILLIAANVRAILGRVRRRVRDGVVPGRDYDRLAGILLSALLLVTPGFITHALAVVFFLPILRRLAGSLITRSFKTELAQAYDYLKIGQY